MYDKPLFQGSSAASIYRPKSNMDATDGDAEMDKVLKSKTKFAGAHGDDLRPEDDAQTSSNGPIQFERQAHAPPKAQPDVFGIDKFLSDSSKKRSDRFPLFFCLEIERPLIFLNMTEMTTRDDMMKREAADDLILLHQTLRLSLLEWLPHLCFLLVFQIPIQSYQSVSQNKKEERKVRVPGATQGANNAKGVHNTYRQIENDDGQNNG